MRDIGILCTLSRLLEGGDNTNQNETVAVNGLIIEREISFIMIHLIWAC